MRIFALLFLLTATTTVHADVKLAQVFSDHMVLQRNAEVPVWGWGMAGEKISVTLGQNSVTAATSADGRWMARLPKMSAGGPHKLVVKGSSTVEVSDVLIGEVWLCSGQSNMAMTVSRAKDFDQEKTKADFPNIRMFKTGAHATPDQQSDCKGTWIQASSKSVGAFSATAWFFGRKLHKELDVPIGLINSSWGGTDVAAWTSLSAQKAVRSIVPKLDQWDAQMAKYSESAATQTYEKALKRWQERAKVAKEKGKKAPRKPRKQGNPANNQNRPANLFNGMIHPLIPYAIRGAIWYQGERNSKSVADGILYGTQLKTMITDWRQRWGQGDFPFITVQLPNYKAIQTQPSETSGWVMVRNAELLSLRLKNTGLAITTDVGQANDIHPKNKQAVGMRLALWALGTTYEQDIVYSGPLFSSWQLKEPSVTATGKEKPGRLDIYFDHIGDHLKTSDGEDIKGFAIAGEDRVWHFAKAKLVDGSRVQLTHKKVPAPIAVRYNWANNPIGNLVNSAGLPAAPFRSDTWKE